MIQLGVSTFFHHIQLMGKKLHIFPSDFGGIWIFYPTLRNATYNTELWPVVLEKIEDVCLEDAKLGGGFVFLFSTLPGEMMKFD